MPAKTPREKANSVIITLLGILFWILQLASFHVSAQTTSEKEKDAIRTAILRETSSFMNVDRRGWSESWVHGPYVYWSYADSTGSSFIEGWDAISKTYEAYFNNEKPSKAKITDEWIEVRVYGTGAFARFIQRSTDDVDTDETSQVRVLEKKDGKWKIVHVGVVARYAKKKSH